MVRDRIWRCQVRASAAGWGSGMPRGRSTVRLTPSVTLVSGFQPSARPAPSRPLLGPRPSAPRSDGVKHRCHVGGPPDLLVWMGGALAPQVRNMVQPGQQNGNAFLDAFTVTDVGVPLVASGTQRIAFAGGEATHP